MTVPSPVRRRRGVLAVVVAASAALLLSACSSSANASPDAGASAKPIVMDTLYGKVTVPAHAARIVAYDFPEATALADLGIKPVGIGSYTPSLPYYDTFFKGVPIITDSNGDPDLEKVAATKPDLIIGDIFKTDIAKDRPLYQKLSAIAPTVILEWKEAAGNWPVDAAGTAQAVGKSAQLDTLKAAYDTHAAQIKKTYATKLASHTVDLISGDATNWYLYGPSSSHGKVLADAGARFAAAADQKDGFVEYSPEKYGILGKSDLLIVAGDKTADAAPLTSNPVFEKLPAAKKGNIVVSSHFFPSSYRIAESLLDDFAAALKNEK